MKRRPFVSTATAAVLLALFLVFLIHQVTFFSISSTSSPSSSTSVHQGKQVQVHKPPQHKKASFAGKQVQVLKPPQHKKASATQFSASVQSIKCDRSHYRYDLCIINGSTVLNPVMSTLVLAGTLNDTISSPKMKIRPYPRKWENGTMSFVKELTLTTSLTNTQCQVHHNSPALVFSTGGYTGNIFHDFNEGFIPLFITIRSLFHDNNPVLVVANFPDWWTTKYTNLIQQFTSYPIINLDKETRTHCFPSAVVGLISHGYMTINPNLLPHSETFHSFRTLIGNAYLCGFSQSRPSPKPRLVLVSRTGDIGRVIKNEDEVIKVAEEIGFEVALFEPTKYSSMSNAYALINSSHAMLGVHGAALTHLLFLRPGSVFIQVVPIGTDWLAETCYGKPAKDIGAEYIEYKIKVKESSLVDKYGIDHPVLHDPDAIFKREFGDFKKIYLKNQDVVLDLDRIQRYLNRAYEKSKKFMDMEG